MQQLVSIQKEALFFDDFRLLSNDEIINATEELHVDFITRNILRLLIVVTMILLFFILKQINGQDLILLMNVASKRETP